MRITILTKPLFAPFRRRNGGLRIAIIAALFGAALLVSQTPHLPRPFQPQPARSSALPSGQAALSPAVLSSWGDLEMDLCTERCVNLEANRLSAALARGEKPPATEGSCRCDRGEAEGSAASPVCATFSSAPFYIRPDVGNPLRLSAAPPAALPIEADLRVDCAADANHSVRVEETWVFPESAVGPSIPRPMPKAMWMASERAGVARL